MALLLIGKSKTNQSPNTEDPYKPYIATELSFNYKGTLQSFVFKNHDILPRPFHGAMYYNFTDSKGTVWEIPFNECIKTRYWVYPEKEEK